MSGVSNDLVAIRRHLHANPELSLVEHETAGLIASELRKLEIGDIRTGVGKTGVLATMRGAKPGPVTLLRADMDALPMQELNETPYVSQRAKIMHACGHDGHVAILLCAARALAARRDEVAGTIVFCFQPGEEGYAGNKLMIEDGALENPRVERTFALHLYSGLDVGKIGVRDGPFFASADEWHLTLSGKGGHGAMPDRAVDPIAAGSYFVTMLQTIVSREVAPKDPAVFTVARFTSGSTFNVIPENAEMEGTVRCFDPDVRASMPQRMERILKGLCAAMRVDYDLKYHWSYPPTINDVRVNNIVRSAGAKVLGKDNVVEHDIVMWAEDMSFMQELRPGAYFIVGSRGGDSSSYPHHNARFDIDERSLEVGYKMMVQLGLNA
ncbi:MAG: amidohydrolase [Candidatus Eremiobacteraeota bacterium]|nr:amidohydrolase [Candidatus Eremiobacteraeota bacterium]